MATGAAAALAVSPFAAQAASPISDESTIDRILGGMTLREKLGQMFIISANGTDMTDWYREQLLQLQPGGVLFFAYNVGSENQVRAYIDAIQRTGRYSPAMIAVDQEGGPVTRVPGDPVPGANQLGTLSDKEVRSFSVERADFLRQYGFNINFAPVADVAYTLDSTMLYRSFGSDPGLVAGKIKAVVSGSRRGKVASAVKHFPGHGRAVLDSHIGLPVVDISLEEWMATDAIPFQAAVDAAVEMVMFGHLQFSQWDEAPTSLSATAVSVLRNDIGFKGVTLTDDLTMGALSWQSPYDLVERSVLAGMDMLLYTTAPVPFTDLVQHLHNRVEDGTIDEAVIDASVRRILAMKTKWFPQLAIPLT